MASSRDDSARPACESLPVSHSPDPATPNLPMPAGIPDVPRVPSNEVVLRRCEIAFESLKKLLNHVWHRFDKGTARQISDWQQDLPETQRMLRVRINEEERIRNALLAVLKDLPNTPEEYISMMENAAGTAGKGGEA